MLSCKKSKIVHEKTKIDILGNLPQELVQDICLYLTGNDICEIWKSSERWKHQIMNENFWKRKCKMDSIQPLEKSKETVASKKLTDRFGCWQGTYFYNHMLHNNWINNIYEEITVEISLYFELRHYVDYFDDEILVIRVRPYNELYIINSSTGKVTNTFSVDTKENYDGDHEFIVKRYNDLLLYVTSLEVLSLISVYFNLFQFEVYVWNIRTNELIMNETISRKIDVPTFQIHQNLIAFRSDTLLNDLYISNINTYNLRHITSEVHKFYFYKKWVALLLTTNSVRILNVEDWTLVTLTNLEKDSDMLLKDQYVITFCENWEISTWNIETLEKIIVFNVSDFVLNMEIRFNPHTKFMLLDDNKIVYRINRSSKFYIWNFLTGTYLLNVDSSAELVETVGSHLAFITPNKISKRLVKYHVEIMCSKSGKQLRKLEMLKIKNISNFLTEKKLLTYNEKGDLVIWDYNQKISIDT